jgi:hypothetical protein
MPETKKTFIDFSNQGFIFFRTNANILKLKFQDKKIKDVAEM